MPDLELVVVRHGRTPWNLNGRFQGHTDVALDSVGRVQAGILCDRLAAERFDVVVTSDLARARETAEAIVRGRGTRVWIDSRWREMNFGAWEGLTWAEIVARFPGLEGPPNAGGAFPHATDGESFDALCVRVAEALAEIRRGSPRGSRALVVTHAGPLHALLHVALGREDAQALGIRFSPASVTRLAFEGGRTRLLALNHTFSAMDRGA